MEEKKREKEIRKGGTNEGRKDTRERGGGGGWGKEMREGKNGERKARGKRNKGRKDGLVNGQNR